MRELNPFAKVVECERAQVDLLQHAVGIHAFDLDHVLKSIPKFADANADIGVGGGEAGTSGQFSLTSGFGIASRSRDHKRGIASVGFDVAGEVDLDEVNRWVVNLLQEKGMDIYRFKGVFAVKSQPHRFVFHGVHMTFDGREDRPWAEGEERRCTLCFIGRNLDRDELQSGLNKCMR